MRLRARKLASLLFISLLGSLYWLWFLYSNGHLGIRDSNSLRVTVLNSRPSHWQHYRQILFTNHTSRGFSVTNSHRCDGHLFLIIFVQSAPSHFAKRKIIRLTWGSFKSSQHRLEVIFIVGETGSSKLEQLLNEEDKLYRDLVRPLFHDSYRNLTLKHLYSLHWIALYCVNRVRFVLKCDDDSFINIPNLIQLLNLMAILGQRNFIYGRLAPNEKVIRYHHKNRVTREEWPEFLFPDFFRGLAYVMSGDLIQPLLVASYTTKLFWLDDVFVSGLLAEKVGARKLDLVKGHGFQWLGKVTRSESLHNYVFLNDEINVLDYTKWKAIWKFLMDWNV